MNSQDLEKYYERKERANGKYRVGSMTGKINTTVLEHYFYELNDRILELENRVLKTERKTITHRGQQMLILHHLGILDKLNELDISGVKKAKLLSSLLNASQDNIKDDLSAINKKDSYLKSTANYKVINKIFKEAGLKKLAEKTEEILDDLNKLEK